MSGQRWHAIQRFSARQISDPKSTPVNQWRMLSSPDGPPMTLPPPATVFFATTLCLFLATTISLLALRSTFYVLSFIRRCLYKPRTKLIPPNSERVLVIGGSSGIGRAIALLYARRGARVCVTGRREEEAVRVAEECKVAGIVEGREGRVLGLGADFTDAKQMVALRETLVREWGGLDTIIVSAGVSALQPLMTLAGVEPGSCSSETSSSMPTVEGVERASRIAGAAVDGNYIGPLITAITFIPLLSQTSPSPSIHLISSLASSIPAPTRTLYASTKSASLQLYRSLSIEHPGIGFSYTLPSTVEGDFRAGAVDASLGPLHEDDPNTKGKSKGLKREYVAKKVVEVVDASAKGGWARGQAVFVPGWYWWVQFVYALWPGFVERRAARKYNFGPPREVVAKS